MKIDRKEGIRGIRIVEHNKVLFWIIILLLVVLIAMLIYIKMHPSSSINGNNTTTIANSASVYCEANNGTLKMVIDPDGSQRGVCVLKSGIECDEWRYYRSECP